MMHIRPHPLILVIGAGKFLQVEHDFFHPLQPWCDSAISDLVSSRM